MRAGRDGLTTPLASYPHLHTSSTWKSGGKAGNFQIHKDTKKISYKTGPAKIIIITINK